jgi:hypothetical protein
MSICGPLKRNLLRLARVVADDIGAADIGRPLFEHRSEIEQDHIVRRNLPNRRIGVEDADAVRTGPHDAAVPMLLDTEFPTLAARVYPECGGFAGTATVKRLRVAIRTGVPI